MTHKLYWDDSHLTEFQARVIDSSRDTTGRRVVVLDQTAFYPLGGGQPADRGMIGTFAVTDVQQTDDGTIEHLVSGDGTLSEAEKVNCIIDRRHRREVTQQHTGQHILSQAFFQLFGAETCGFRISDRVSEIDLALDAPLDQIPLAIERAEDLANEIVLDDRQVRTHQLTPEEAARLPLRKESFVSDCVRVVEIVDFDWSPCGGTHAQRTGEVGLIAVRGWQRAKRMVRLEFVCGLRALDDYRRTNRTASAIARRFSVARDEADDSVARMLEENKALTRRGRELAELACKAEAQELIDATDELLGRRLISRVLEGRNLDELKLLAHRLAENTTTVVLLGSRDGGAARLVFARSSDLSLDVSQLMRVACQTLGGKGGGTPDFAQGGGTNPDQLDAAIAAATQACS